MRLESVAVNISLLLKVSQIWPLGASFFEHVPIIL